jgi:acetyl-CoA carboxylase biotin carboxyl carrier protein
VEQQVDVDRKTLDELIALMRRDGLDRLRVEVGEITLDLRMTELSANAHPAAEVKRNASLDTPRQQSVSPDTPPPGVTKVLAPLVGVFYRAPAPGAKPFVEVGDEVTAGHVLCILEAMKLMNEIVSEHNGRVVRICAEDGQLASLHQELFWIET